MTSLAWSPLLAVRQAQSFCTDCNLSIGLWGYSGVVLREAHSKKSASRLRETDRLNQTNGRLPALVEKESDTRAHQVLPQIATLISIELGARVIEVVVFDKSTKVRIKEVI